MSTKIVGEATTAHASRYLQQLCKHWGHRFEVSFDAERGQVALPGGPLELEARPQGLHLTIAPADADAAARMKGVIEEHLNRFAHKEAPLPFSWSETGA